MAAGLSSSGFPSTMHPFSEYQFAAPSLEFSAIFQSDLVNLVFCELLTRGTGRGAGFAEEAVETGGGYDPEEEELVVGVGEAAPVVRGNEDG